MKRISAAVIALLVFATSCQFLGGERISGDGHITTQSKNTGSFSSVDVSGSVKVHVRQDASNSVKIEADQNLMEYIEVYTEGDKLVIKTKNGYNLSPSKDIVAYISAPVYKDIDVSGACDVIGENAITGNSELSMHTSGSGNIQMEVNIPKLSTEVSGNGNISLKGKVTDFSATVSGSGDIRCFDLETENTRLDLSGSSDAEVNANKSLNVDASGSSQVKYKGNASVSQDISGSGSVKKVG